MAHIGSAFLGDIKRQRILSTSTPPSSPPPANTSPSAYGSFQDIDEEIQQQPPSMISNINPEHPPPPTISPEVSLDLRIRWLETLVYGTKRDAQERQAASDNAFSRPGKRKNNPTLVRGVEELQKRTDAIVQSSEGLRRFMDHYDQHANILNPTFALSGSIPSVPSSPYETMSLLELSALLVEMEPDIRSADNDLRDIELLEQKGVTGAGSLGECESLQSRLDELLDAHEEDVKKAAELEARVARLVERHSTNVDTLSELFVAWDDTLRNAEEDITRIERDYDERKKLGYA